MSHEHCHCHDGNCQHGHEEESAVAETMEKLESTPALIISGVCLTASLALHLTDVAATFDPAWIVLIISGLPIVKEATGALIEDHRITSELLVTVAMAACIYIGEYFASAEVAFIMAIGEKLEQWTVERARRGLQNLIAIQPDTAEKVAMTGETTTVETKDLKVGDIVRIRPGERVPVDGEIVSGETTIDQSVITGESLPVDKGEKDKVYAGTLNQTGAVDVRVGKESGDTQLQRMIALVREAEGNKAPMEKTVDKWAQWLVPASMLIAIVTYMVTGDVTRAVTVLVVFCPCALALATPVSVVAGIGQATKYGVLVKSGEALEKMANVDTVTFDKTGTLTMGRLQVSDIVGAPETLSMTASAEAKSEHPLAKAVIAKAETERLPRTETKDFRSLPGKGVSATVGGREVVCATVDHLRTLGTNIPAHIEQAVTEFRSQGKATILTQVDGTCIGAIALQDTLRSEAKEIVSGLHGQGVDITILTGDSQAAAEHLARQVGIRDVRAGLLPDGKVEAIRRLQQEGHKVAMVGDGVNDAPALKAADIGIAMGKLGSDIAVESADIVLESDDISRLPYLKRLSRAVLRSITTNISISMGINAVAITLSVLGLLGPISGALVHNVGSVLVVLNAALLYDRKI